MRAADLTPGDARTAVVAEDLSRTEIAMYAGASGDFNPLHTDEVYATQVAGYDTVIAHGQLTMALTAKLVTQWVDEARLVSFGVRFVRQVWPGDTLSVTATVTAVDPPDEDPLVHLELVTSNQDGDKVVTGYATLRDY
jgi:acyl dehydratase